MPFFGKCGCSSSSRVDVEELNILNYAHNNLTHVPEEIILHERALEELYLDANRISELPRWLFQCHGLKILSLNDNEFQSISPAIASLVNLENLDISKNGIQEIPDVIKCCKRLSIVEASVNPIGRLPEGFMMLINLRELYLNDTFLEYLPGSFGRLNKLKILEVRENRLKTLPKSLARLIELERLDLGTNDFDIFPEVISKLVSLLELWMDNNRIEYLPKEIRSLKNLMFLDLSKNKLKELPNEIGECSALSDLYLSENQIFELPESIGQLSSLTILKLDVNHITRIPFSIGGLSSLSELILSKNKIEKLPTSIGLLRNLRTLNVDENNLTELPTDIGSCTGITLFSLRGNNIEYLPDEIGRINKLRVLNLSSNKLKYLPCSISKLTELQALWLTENQTKPLIPLQQDKDKNGKRFLTCYLFPQDFLVNDKSNNNNNNNNNRSILKSNYNLNTDIEEQNYYDRHHLIRFTGDSSQAINNNPSDESLMKPYPKEMKNPVHHLKNLAIYENNASHLFNNNFNEVNELTCGLQAEFIKSLNFKQNKKIDEEEQFLLINNELENNFNQNIDLNNVELMNRNLEYSDTDSDDLNEIMKLANNKNHETHNRVSFATNTCNSNSFEKSPHHRNKNLNMNNQDYMDLNDLNKKQHEKSKNGEEDNFSKFFNSSPRTATKLNHQKLISKMHYDKVQEILNNQNGMGSYSESPPTLHRQYMPQYFMQNDNINENKFPLPPALLLANSHFNSNYQSRNQEPYNHQSITNSPNLRKSILKQTNTNYENFIHQKNKSPNSSPLLNTQITRQNFLNGKSSAMNIPSSPLKVNVNDMKWTNLKINNISNNNGNDAPSSQLSSDSGYSGQTAIQVMNSKINSLNSSPTTNDQNDSFLPSYEYHQQKQKTNLFAVQVIKNPGLGFSISGGKGSIGNPFKPNDPGIFVTKINPEGPAANLLKPGDQILKVNGEDYTNIEHEKAVETLKSCNKFANLLIKRSF